MVDSHPHVAIPPETHFLVPLAGDPRTASAPLGETLSRIFRHFGFARLDLSEELVRRTVAALAPSTPGELLSIVFALYAVAQGKQRWGEKTPIQVFYMPMLSEVFPGARFVHVIRDGRDTAASLAAMSWGPHSLMGAAFTWRTAVRKGRDDGLRLGASVVLEQHLEQIVADPARHMSELCAFIGEPFDDAMLNYHESARERTVTLAPGSHPNVLRPPTEGLRDWREGRSEREVQALQVYLRGRLDEFGYDTVSYDWRTEMRATAYAYLQIAKASPRIAGVVHARSGRHSAVVARGGQVAAWLSERRSGGR